MEDFVGLAILVVAALVTSIIALAKFGGLKASTEELKRRVIELERRDETPAAKAAPAKAAMPPPLPASVTVPQAAKPATGAPSPVPQPPPPTPFNWESVLGVKLFAWIGGLALFLGIVFFVKYAFENNWITPVMRIVAGGIVGAALIVVGVLPRLRRYRVPAQSLCATGILILYANVYAAHSFYGLIPLTAATALMWIVTGGALLLANYLNVQSVAWLAVLGGFLTPAILWKGYGHPVPLFGYVAVLNFGVAGLGLFKRWNYLILLTAIGSVIAEFSWTQGSEEVPRNIFLAMEVQFLAICIIARSARRDDIWSVAAAALAGFAVFVFCIVAVELGSNFRWDFIFPILLLANCGLIALAVIGRSSSEKSKLYAAIIAAALALTWFAEWPAHDQMFGSREPLFALAWYVAIFLLFAAIPYFCGPDRLWPWMIGAAAGPLQFWFVYQLMLARFPDHVNWLLPVAFAVPAAIGLWYLVKKEHIDLASGDSRLATQGAAVLAFVSLVFPVQFHHEWITLGWAIEGLALILLFRWIPNRRLRVVALIVLGAAFVRLALNPAVLEYHPRTRVPIWNWYLYAYGVSALCFFLSGRWFGDPREKDYERIASPLLYSLAGLVAFLLMNIEIADYFSIGPTLTFSFSGNFARDMTYTIAWAIFAFGLLVIGIAKSARAARLAAIALLCLAFAKLFLHDLDSLSQLYRIGAFITVAVIAIVASFIYQRFLLPRAKT